MAAAALGAAVLGILVPTVSRAQSQSLDPMPVRLAAAPAAPPAASSTAARPGALASLLGLPEAPIAISRVSDEHDLADAPALGSVPTAAVDATSVLSSGFVRPVAGAVSSGFGARFHPILQVWKLHTGTDIGAACGAAVVAVKDGLVSFAGAAAGYGNRVVVDHGQGLATTYNHFSSYAAAAGMPVRQGQIIGYVGTTGLSTGCHLHFEVEVNGRIVDSGPYLDLAPAPAATLPAAAAPTTALTQRAASPPRVTPTSPPPATPAQPRPAPTAPPPTRPPATTSAPPTSSTTSTSDTSTSATTSTSSPAPSSPAPSSPAPSVTAPSGSGTQSPTEKAPSSAPATSPSGKAPSTPSTASKPSNPTGTAVSATTPGTSSGPASSAPTPATAARATAATDESTANRADRAG